MKSKLPLHDKVYKWDSRLLGLCREIAKWSEDPSRQVGCVISGSANNIVSTGYNGLPRGISHSDPAKLVREHGEKYMWVEHAERNAIYNAARAGIPLSGCTLYSNLFPCADCARAIIQSGIQTLVTYSAPSDETRFLDSMNISMKMFNEAEIQVRLY